MKTRNELIEEIVGESLHLWNKLERVMSDDESKKQTGYDYSIWVFRGDVERVSRTALLRISDASMDAVEVEGITRNTPVYVESNPDLTKTTDESIIRMGYETARTASKRKRKEWTK